MTAQHDDLLVLERREQVGRGAARQARREDKVPGVLYGGSDTHNSVPVSVKERTAQSFFHRSDIFSHVFSVNLDGKKSQVLVRDLQLHPVTEEILSFDLLRVGPRTKTHMLVPVIFSDLETAPVIKQGAILTLLRHEVELFGPVLSIPQNIELTIGDRKVGDVIRISDVSLPKGVVPTVSDRNFTIASIVPPKVGPLTESSEEEEEEESETEYEDT